MSSPEAGTPDSEATEPPADDATAPAAEGATADDTPGESAAPSRWRRFGAWWQRNITHFSYAGALVGTLLLWLSFTPSLLPRGPLFQGLVSGGSAAVGYMIGTFFAYLARYLISRKEPWRRAGTTAWSALGVVCAIGTAVMLYFYGRWQNEIRDLMGVAHSSWTAYPILVVVTVIAFTLLVVIGQLWGAGVRDLTRRLNRRVPPRISAVTAVAIAVVLTVFVVNGMVADYGMRALNSSFAALNSESTPDSDPPTSNLRSGGPESKVSWKSLGRMGRAFVSSGPTTEQLTEFNGTPAKQPIRVYAGLESADGPLATAQLVVDELERTGAFQRKLIGIGMTTGTGWINRSMPDSLEYMYNGDTAMASMQYSMLPSWLSFLVDQERARQAGVALFEAVDVRLRRIPEAQRPKVVVFGESLGSFGGEAPFGSMPTLLARTNGALFTGPTFSNTLWNDVTRNRQPGSPEWQPVYRYGDQVRFIADGGDLPRTDAAPHDTRMVYVQHASDPISWWSPKLLFNKPDWLREKRGPDVLPATRWIPVVTFLQVSADMAVAANVPDGHGHTYLAAIPQAWAWILTPPGWTPEKTQRLIPKLTRS